MAARLRKRILRGLASGSLTPGRRLPSAREAGADFHADYRVVLAAYRQLAREGLVELRERSGIYVARGGAALLPTPGVEWLIDVFLQGLTREVPVVQLRSWIQRSIESRQLHAIVIEGSRDSIAAMSLELREDYAFEVTGLNAADLAASRPDASEAIARADLLVTTKEFTRPVRAIGKRAGVSVVVAQVGPDLLGGDWRTLLQKPLYFLVSDASSVATAERNFASVAEAATNLHVMLVGRDDVASIPPEAAVYITRGAAEVLGNAPVGGRPLPRARLFSWKTARELIGYIVSANLAAWGRTMVNGSGAGGNA